MVCEVKHADLFPIGGKARERWFLHRMIRLNSGADGIVRMKEGQQLSRLFGLDILRGVDPAPFNYWTGFFMKTSPIEKNKRFTQRFPALGQIVLIPLSIIAALLLWQLLTKIGRFPAFILPSPALVWQKLLIVLADGSLLRNLFVTLEEILVGLTFGVGIATILGYFLAKSTTIERLLSPYIVASQSVPIVAIAPLLVIWFGSGILSKVLICALIVFFPVLVNTVVGLHSVPDDLHDLMRSLQANRWQTIRFLEIPAALPVFLGGLKIGATLSVIGALVGEFVASDRGLGFMINRARGQYDTALVFVTVLVLIILALSLYGSVVLIERRFLAWHEQSEENITTLKTK
jgi:NitT/TauT family transport system permease protein